MKRCIPFILCVFYSFSQENINIPFLQEDIFLKYDTLFSPITLHEDKTPAIITFDEQRVKNQLDSLNQLTPINLVYNQAVANYIQVYLFKRPEQVSRLLSLGDYYFPIFEKYLDQNNLPIELKYLPVIESSLNPHAKSPAGAVGLWQFMYPTAKEHGLRINSYLDERKDLYKSTAAACEYFIKSQKIFNNWELSIASYNAGRRNVTKSIRRSGGKYNFWEIRPFLPQETQNYIPAFIAAVYVMNCADFYGIKRDTGVIFKPFQVDSINVKRRLNLNNLADLLDVEKEILLDLNPMYKLQLIPSLKDEKFPLVLPDYKWAQFILNQERIYAELVKLDSLQNVEYPIFSDIEKIKYYVKRGDYLGKIANRYKCKVKDIMLWNDLTGTQIKEGQKLYIYRIIK